MKSHSVLPALLLSLFAPLAAQVGSRTEQIEEARKQKAATITPDTPSKTEQQLVRIKDERLIERFTQGIAGFRVRLGGLATYSGFALGPEYFRPDLAKGELNLRSSARFSFRGYQLYDLQLTAPKLARDKLLLDFYVIHRNYPRLDYYGPGPDSEKSGRTHYRLEDTGFEGTAAVEILPRLRLGGKAGYLMVNVGPGTDRRFASTETVFTPATTPGLRDQTDFLRAGAFLHFDTRDNPLGPRSGGSYALRYHHFADRDLRLHTFDQVEVDLSHYFGFFNKRRVFALRSKNVFTFAESGQRVPFYLQPQLGGSDDLRGFRPFRFYDNNMMVMNAEYRWEVFSGLDMALFADAGKVFTRRRDWGLDNLESAVGFGFRFNARNQVFMRIDTGFSHEGFQVWVKFGNIFLEPFLER